MDSNDWQQRNLAAIAARVAYLRDLPDGIIHDCPGTLHHLQIRKTGTRLEMMFQGGQSREVISDFDYAKPMDLYAGFTQAMTLGLLWKPEPSQVYVLGFGAGRVPMVLHHHFPTLRLEGTDIDAEVVAAARRFCGIQPDERLRVIIEDGRRYLADRPADVRYDIILVDAFRGVGYSPPMLATAEFYQTCRDHLASDGVLVVNLTGWDYLIKEKIRTLVDGFAAVYCVPIPSDGTVVLFASDQTALSHAELFERARLLAKHHGFAFPFAEHAIALQQVMRMPELAAAIADIAPLTDAIAAISQPPADSTAGDAPPQ